MLSGLCCFCGSASVWPAARKREIIQAVYTAGTPLMWNCLCKNNPLKTTFSPVRFLSARSVRLLKSFHLLSVLKKKVSQVQGIFFFFLHLWCVISFWGSESWWQHKKKLTSLFYCFLLFCFSLLPKVEECSVNGVKRLDIPDIHIRVLAIISLDWYQVVLRHPPSPPLRPSVAEFLISVKTMACLSLGSK